MKNIENADKPSFNCKEKLQNYVVKSPTIITGETVKKLYEITETI